MIALHYVFPLVTFIQPGSKRAEYYKNNKKKKKET